MRRAPREGTPGNPVASVEASVIGDEIHALIAALYPICRSMTGNGLRESFRVIGKAVPLVTTEVPTGTRVFDWVIPQEWNIADAFVKNSRGERVIDFQRSNLHVVGYSSPIRRSMRLSELKPHLFSLPERPDWIPFRHTYHETGWGFCLADRDLSALRDDDIYEVCIDSSLIDGALTLGECYLPGVTEDEVLVCTHMCHPSLCNDNLSGVAVATMLAKHLASKARRYSYRFLFVPTTIGSIAWLALNETRLPAIKHGLVLTCLGDSGHVTYKRSRRGDAEIDRATANVLAHSGRRHDILPFSPIGCDERQFCSPGFDLPIGCLMRTPYGCFPQYHTSADDLDFVRPPALADSFRTCLDVLGVLEMNGTYVNLNPKGEPQLGRRGLYRSFGDGGRQTVDQTAVLWVLNLSDGNHSLLDIAERAGLDFVGIRRAADALLACGLLGPVSDQSKG
jgi:aminopeptidase-like protein